HPVASDGTARRVAPGGRSLPFLISSCLRTWRGWMAYREVSVIEVREVLRGWLAGAGLRTVAGQAGVDRKTARRYAQGAEAAGLARDGGWGQVSDDVVGAVVAAVRPARPAGHSSA